MSNSETIKRVMGAVGAKSFAEFLLLDAGRIEVSVYDKQGRCIGTCEQVVTEPQARVLSFFLVEEIVAKPPMP